MHIREMIVMTSDFLPEERRQQILNILTQEGKVTAPDLSQRLDVSEDTIRRDLKDLEKAGHLNRVHGGALPRSPSNASYHKRQALHLPTKASLAKETAKLIQPDQLVLIDSGTTALAVARNLTLDLKATIVTTSPPVVMALAEHHHINVIMLGGNLDRTSMSVTGSATLKALNRVRADVCILGVCSLHEEIGVTTGSFEEAELKRLMITNASEVIAVTTAEKIGTAASFVVTSINHISHIVTEASVSDESLTPYQNLGIDITRVKT